MGTPKSKPSSSPVHRNKSPSELYSSSSIAAVRPEGATSLGADPSAEATRPPGVEEVSVGAGVGEPAGAGVGGLAGLLTSLRLRSLSRGQLAGTCQGFSAQWQMGQIPLPAMALSQRVLMDFTENEEIHSNGLDHSLPALSMATAEAPGPPLRGF